MTSSSTSFFTLFLSLSLSLSLSNSLVGSALDLHLSAAALICFGWLFPGVLRLWRYCYWSQEMDLQENSVSGNLQRNQVPDFIVNIIGLLSNIIGRLHMSSAYVFPFIWCLVYILIDPFYIYATQINYDYNCVALADNSWPISKFVLDSISTVILGVGCLVFTLKVFGALWYSFAIDKVIECWEKAGKKYALKFSEDAFVCPGTLRDYNFLNEFCPAKTQNRAIYDFGIYRDALESGIVETTNLPKKVLYCFRWGLQNLRYSMGNHLCSSSVQVTEIQSFLQRLSVQSAFGQSLQASTDTWENIFVISITIYSMLLFVFFIGNVQVYLQSKTIQSEMIRQKKQQIEQCTSFAKLSKDLRKKIKRYQPDVWEETKGVDFEFLFNLPEDLRKNMKRELCLELLKKVDEFKDWSEKLLEELCDCVKPVSYAQQTLIVQKDSPIDKMLFLVQGELQTYSLTSVDRLKKGEFCGKELVDCFQADLYPSNLPISTRTIQTITKVDAFALMSYDLQNVFIKHRTQVQAPPPPAEPPAQQCCNCWGKC
ncbi:hypothetical protein LWI29_031933 [Acer saccharum]|uniref:Cyclic nucleotide-binding domain-containing protein n=1 Tax=Acer saccharum TaxID=4024 RepID=A0AA39SVN3_ACESA|nr:hypothetical protein LWI29_031933 [Acer saccharum]